MPITGFEHMITVFDRSKNICALERVTTLNWFERKTGASRACAEVLGLCSLEIAREQRMGQFFRYGCLDYIE